MQAEHQDILLSDDERLAQRRQRARSVRSTARSLAMSFTPLEVMGDFQGDWLLLL